MAAERLVELAQFAHQVQNSTLENVAIRKMWNSDALDQIWSDDKYKRITLLTLQVYAGTPDKHRLRRLTVLAAAMYTSQRQEQEVGHGIPPMHAHTWRVLHRHFHCEGHHCHARNILAQFRRQLQGLPSQL